MKSYAVYNYFWYHNFMFQDSTPDKKSPYHELMSKVGWFFFDLLVLGYVEDPSSGKSFHFPANHSWKLFIEVSYTITFGSSKLALSVYILVLCRFHQEVQKGNTTKILSSSKQKCQS